MRLWAFPCVATLVAVVRAGETWHDPNFALDGTIGSGDLTAAAAAVRTLIAKRKDAQNDLHNEHDVWKHALDENTLEMWDKLNLTQANADMVALTELYRSWKHRNEVRNAELEAENTALNNTVQVNEQIIKNINQTHYGLERNASMLDAQNIELSAEVGALRDGNLNSVRYFGLTRQRQNVVQRKLLNKHSYESVEALAHAMRTTKKNLIETVTKRRGEKNNAEVNNEGLEMHPVTHTAQRNLEQTLKLLETHKKKNMNVRRDTFQAQANTLETNRVTLEDQLETLVIQNARLRELYSEALVQRLDVKKDRDQQKWNYVQALLQRNAAVTYKDKMKALYQAAAATRDAENVNYKNRIEARTSKFIEATNCEENNRHLEQHILSLTQRNALLRNNCYGQ